MSHQSVDNIPGLDDHCWQGTCEITDKGEFITTGYRHYVVEHTERRFQESHILLESNIRLIDVVEWNPAFICCPFCRKSAMKKAKEEQ